VGNAIFFVINQIIYVLDTQLAEATRINVRISKWATNYKGDGVDEMFVREMT